jgi:hypothetical protein
VRAAEPTEAGAVFRRVGLFSTACATIFHRLAARPRLQSMRAISPRRNPGFRQAASSAAVKFRQVLSSFVKSCQGFA